MDNLEKVEAIDIYEKYLPKNVTASQLDQIGSVSADLYQIAQMPDSNVVKGVLLAQCLNQLRELFTPEIMAPIMSLQGSPLGFLTDKDKKRTSDGYVKGDGYSWDVVRDCHFYCTAQGARITGNEMNILASNPYLTKKFFERMNNENLGRDKWRCTFDVPVIESQNVGNKIRITATVSGVCVWTDKNGEHKENLTAKIKGDEYASNDAYTGKWERKAFKLVFEKSTGRKVDDGDVDDMINVTPIDQPPKSRIPDAAKIVGKISIDQFQEMENLGKSRGLTKDERQFIYETISKTSIAKEIDEAYFVEIMTAIGAAEHGKVLPE